jgi:hypothetical protein
MIFWRLEIKLNSRLFFFSGVDMKILTLLLATFAVSVGLAKPPAEPVVAAAMKTSPVQRTEDEMRRRIESLKPEDRRDLGKIVSFLLLSRVKGNLEAFTERHDPKALAELLRPWNPEEQNEIKAELLAVTDKPSFKVDGASLFITVKDETVELAVQDPFDGIFRINGHMIRINPATKYRYFKEQIDALTKVSANKNPLLGSLVPNAEAGVVDAVVKIGSSVAKFVRPAGAATAGVVKTEAVETGDAVGDAWMQMGMEKRALKAAKKAEEAEALRKQNSTVRKMGKWTVVKLGVGGGTFYAGSMFGCGAGQWDLDTVSNKCVKSLASLPAKIMCDKKIKVEGCVDTVGGLDSVKGPNGEVTYSPTYIPGEGCVPTANGYSKKLSVEKRDGAEVTRVKAINPSAPLPPPLTTTSIEMTFNKDSDPKSPKILKKSITEVITSNVGKTKDRVIGQRVWTYTDEKHYTITIFGALTKENGEFLDVSKVPTQTLSCNEDELNKDCKDLYDSVIGGLGKEKNCDPPKNKQILPPNRGMPEPMNFTR